MRSRREFLADAAMAAGVFATGGCRSLGNCLAGGDCRLRLGVMSDIHLTWNVDEPGSYERIEKVLRYYRDRNVDGVVIAGDIADWGFVGQLVEFGELWRKVFPDDRAPDGHHVERLFIAGNHELEGPYEPFQWKGKSILKQKSEFIRTIGIDKAWEKAFGEKYEPIWIRQVKGYAFTGAHWKCEHGLKDFLAAHKSEIDPRLPYFHIQHPHPLGTVYDGVYAANSWCYDHGAAKKALVDFPNAVALSGHTHLPLTDERSIWQGEFTSIGTASLSYISQLGGRENTSPENRVSQMEEINPWPWKNPDRGHHFMVFEVFDDRIEVERMDSFQLARLGENWVIPTDAAKRPYEYKSRSKSFPPPEFPSDAKVRVTGPVKGKNRRRQETMQVCVSFPTANAGKSRAYEYEVVAESVEDNGKCMVKRVFSPSYHLSLAAEVKGADCVFAVDELPKGKCRFSVTPLSSFGTRGRKIAS